MAVPKHKRFRKDGVAVTPTPLLVTRKYPNYLTLSGRLRGTIPLSFSSELPRVGCHLFSQSSHLATPYVSTPAHVHVNSRVFFETLLTSESGFFLRSYFLRSFSRLIDTHWFWSSFGYARFTRWLSWAGLSFFVHTTHPVALNRTYYLRYGMLSLGVLYHFRRRPFFRDLGVIPLPYKRTLKLSTFIHSPVFWKFGFEYLWGDSLRDRADYLDLTLDELSPVALDALYPNKAFWGWHTQATYPASSGTYPLCLQCAAPRQRRWART